VLEADLWRAEARGEEVLRQSARGGERNARTEEIATREGSGEDAVRWEVEGSHRDEDDEEPVGQEHGIRLWREKMERRFLRGEDAEFEYRAVDDGGDGSEERREEEERWFESEEESWEKESHDGETGVQDF